MSGRAGRWGCGRERMGEKCVAESAVGSFYDTHIFFIDCVYVAGIWLVVLCLYRGVLGV